jgi:hypothetical protein
MNQISRKWIAIATCLICWFLSLILPHFQENMSTPFVVFQIALSVVLFFSIKKTLAYEISISDLRAKLALLSIAFIHFMSLLLVKVEISDPYILWNRFGSGTMLKDDKVFPFGDLSHLTAAASCSKRAMVGELLCDPFDRIFNQNPHIVEFIRLTNLDDLLILGIISSVLFYVSVLVIISKFKNVRLQIFITITSPPLILALDRGNEILTITLIIFGLYLVSTQRKYFSVGYFLLSLSAIFKVWPIFLVFFILLFNLRKLGWLSRIILSIPIIYWAVFYKNLIGMINSTQYRSPYGLSFGLNHYLNDTLEPLFLITFALFIAVSLFYLSINVKRQLIFNQQLINLFLPLLLTYVCLWVYGTHFSYRLVILIPILILLPVYEKNKSNLILLNSVIITVLITARLSVTTALTTLLALIFCALILNEIISNKSINYLLNKAFNRLVVMNKPVPDITKK